MNDKQSHTRFLGGLALCFVIMFLLCPTTKAQFPYNPNPPGNTITIDTDTDTTEDFENQGNVIIEEPNALTNLHIITNSSSPPTYGFLIIDGYLYNYGDIDNWSIIHNAGTIDNYGTIDNQYFIENSGATNNEGGGLIDNSGYIQNLSTINNEGTINNLTGGVIDNEKVDSTIVNLGDIYNSGFIDNLGDIDNNYDSTIYNSGNIRNPGDINNKLGGDISNEGYIDNVGYIRNAGNIDNEGTINNTFGTFINDGIYQGTGTFIGTLDTGSGIVAPGSSAGTMYVEGDYILDGTGTLEIEIGGFTPDSGLSDLLDITGTATLTGGTIDFLFIDGYDISSEILPGDSMTLPFLQADGGIIFDPSLANYSLLGGPSGFLYDVYQDGDVLYFQATNMIPAPGAVLLGGIGVGLVGWLRRRRTI